MFNGYFYEEGGEEVCREFLQSGKVAMVIDPPFGGLVHVLARQVQHLWRVATEGQKVGQGLKLLSCSRVV